MKTSLSPEVERLIEEKVRSGHYRSADEVVQRGLALLQKDEDKVSGSQFSSSISVAALFESIAGNVPDADWQKVPADLSRNLNHHLYGTQKTS